MCKIFTTMQNLIDSLCYTYMSILKLIQFMKNNQKKNLKNSVKIIELIHQNQNITIPEIAKLKEQGKIKRIRLDKGGYWKVLEK